jgi:hypothetical protein
VPKVNIPTPAGLDAFVDQLVDGAPVMLADMGAGSAQVTYEWFDRMYPDVAEAGIAFTAIGVVIFCLGTQKCAPIRNLELLPKLLCKTVDSSKGMVLQTVDSQ